MSTPVATVTSDAERTHLDESGTMRSARPHQHSHLGPGSLLAGKYRLELLLGAGGMGHVWSAYNAELELPVAIKLLRTEQKTASLAERLRLEARSAARLVHPSIVRVFDIAVTEDGDPFIVMELLTGESLAEVLSRGRLSGVRAVQLMLPIAEGLALAHARGIVHRDLKPDNVFLSTDSEQLQPKLLDFGIAKLVHATALAEKLTVKGMLLGSPNYMSPEQARGDEVDYRSDIWSFCVVLYKAVMGASPFSGTDKHGMMAAIISREPTSLTFDASVDPQLARLIAWGLSKEPEQRPTSIRELGRQLARWLLAQGVSDDACGAPLAAKWISQVAEPSMRRPPPLATSFDAPPLVPAETLSSRASAPHSVPTVAFLQPQTRRSLPLPRQYWPLLAAVFMVFAAAGLTWKATHRAAAGPSAMVDTVAQPPRAHPYLPVLPAAEVAAPVELQAAPAAVVEAQAQARAPAETMRRVSKAKATPAASRSSSAPRLPFP
jgi:eukaryotic-like serine/threonine-protein kinase